MKKISRRKFLKASAASTAAFMILPRWVIGKEPGPNSIINVAVVGPGGRGTACCRTFGRLDFTRNVAFADVDFERAKPMFDQFPDAKRFKDYRVMLDEMGKDIDAVAIATPDHAHYPAGAWSMACGKHVYIEKPLARTVWETQELKRIAQKQKVITQMGNQGHTFDGWRKLREWYEAGLLGEIEEIHQWTDRPVPGWWDQGALPRPDGSEKVPEHLDFNLWLNVAPEQAYSGRLLPFKWRGMRDFGTSALGDMGCHFMDFGYSAFDLGFPTSITGTSTEFNDFSWPQQSSVVYEFPAKGSRKPVKLYWYDFSSKNKPKNVKGVEQEKIDSMANGSIVVGSKRSALCEDPYGGNTRIWPLREHQEMMKSKAFPEASIPRVEGGPHQEWARAIRDGVQPGSNIVDFSADFTAVVMMGLITNFFPGKKLDFDPKNLTFTNEPKANEFLKSVYPYRKEFLPGI